MSFPVYSTSTQTRRIARTNRVMQRSKVEDLIRNAGVFNCKQTTGTTLWSPHARGDATDLMLKVVSRKNAETVGRNVVAQATKRTFANRGRKLDVVHIIFGNTQWVRGQGLSHYDGVAHDNHVHVGGSFSSPVKPPCA